MSRKVVGALLILLLIVTAGTLCAAKLEVALVGPWDQQDVEAVKKMLVPFTADTGIQVIVDALWDDGELRARIEAGNPPDVVLLFPSTFHDLISDSKLVRLDKIMDLEELKNEYSQTWLALGSSDEQLYGIPFSANLNNLVWYNPKVFAKCGYEVPATWPSLLDLSDKIVAEGGVPWCIGLECGAASGWPGATWIETILLGTAGAETYSAWINYAIPWDILPVKRAWRIFGEITLNEQYLYGGCEGALSTNFSDAPKPLFTKPEGCYMYFGAGFMEDVILGANSSLVAGEDYDIFPLPALDPYFGTPGIVSVGFLASLNTRSETGKLMAHLTGSSSQKIWVGETGHLSPNRGVPFNAYPSSYIVQKSAHILHNLDLIGICSSDLMPGALGSGQFWYSIMDYVAGIPLGTILEQLNNAANDAYELDPLWIEAAASIDTVMNVTGNLNDLLGKTVTVKGFYSDVGLLLLDYRDLFTNLPLSPYAYLVLEGELPEDKYAGWSVEMSGTIAERNIDVAEYDISSEGVLNVSTCRFINSFDNNPIVNPAIGTTPIPDPTPPSSTTTPPASAAGPVAKKPDKFALLISGGGRISYPRYWNDLVHFWQLLHDKGYDEKNIEVLYFNGLRGDKTASGVAIAGREAMPTGMNIDRAATMKDVEEAFTALKKGIAACIASGKTPSLIVFTTDHGGGYDARADSGGVRGFCGGYIDSNTNGDETVKYIESALVFYGRRIPINKQLKYDTDGDGKPDYRLIRPIGPVVSGTQGGRRYRIIISWEMTLEKYNKTTKKWEIIAYDSADDPNPNPAKRKQDLIIKGADLDQDGNKTDLIGIDTVLILTGKDRLTDDKLKSLLQGLLGPNLMKKENVFVVMEQCFSGGFDDLKAVAVRIATACARDEPSSASYWYSGLPLANREKHVDLFAYYFTQKLRGEATIDSTTAWENAFKAAKAEVEKANTENNAAGSTHKGYQDEPQFIQ